MNIIVVFFGFLAFLMLLVIICLASSGNEGEEEKIKKLLQRAQIQIRPEYISTTGIVKSYLKDVIINIESKNGTKRKLNETALLALIPKLDDLSIAAQAFVCTRCGICNTHKKQFMNAEEKPDPEKAVSLIENWHIELLSAIGTFNSFDVTCKITKKAFTSRQGAYYNGTATGRNNLGEDVTVEIKEAEKATMISGIAIKLLAVKFMAKEMLKEQIKLAESKNNSETNEDNNNELIISLKKLLTEIDKWTDNINMEFPDITCLNQYIPQTPANNSLPKSADNLEHFVAEDQNDNELEDAIASLVDAFKSSINKQQ